VGFDNNPIFLIDPNGTSAGDYYSRDGTHLGNDGKDDNKVYTVEGNFNQSGGSSMNNYNVVPGDARGPIHVQPRSNGQSSSVVQVSEASRSGGNLYNIHQIPSSSITELPINHSTFLQIAASIHNEDRGEIVKMAIGNAIINR